MTARNTSFRCQLAHGSPTVTIQDFSSLKAMYERIAEKFNGISSDDILYCTVNTHMVDMNRLATTNLGLDDFIFAHVKGNTKEVKFSKKSKVIGITLMVNNAGKCILKALAKDSEAASVPELQPGLYVESFNGEPLTGVKYAWEAANRIRNVPVGETITMTLIEPLKSGFSFIGPRNELKPKQTDSSDGTKTLRLKSSGEAEIQEAPNKKIIDRMNEVFDSYLGFNDDELALTVWEISSNCKDFIEMGQRIRESNVGAFKFPDELIFDMWGIVNDWKSGLLSEETPKPESKTECVHRYWATESAVDDAELKEYERKQNDGKVVTNK